MKRREYITRIQNRKSIITTAMILAIGITIAGCGNTNDTDLNTEAASQDELVQMLNNGDQIEIEIAVPKDEEQGTEVTYEWTQLDQLTTNPELRTAMDTNFGITKTDTGKEGILYKNLNNESDGNSTLYYLFANESTHTEIMSSYLGFDGMREALAQEAADNYVDVDAEDTDKAVMAALNGYYNLLADTQESYANMDSTLTRLEAMSAIFKAENPVVDDLSTDEDFNNLVDPSNKSNLDDFASNLSEQSYLSTATKSLDSVTANGTITRGELVYMLVQQYYADEYKAVDLTADTKCYKDAKNGGDIAKENNIDITADYGESYELNTAIQNADKGCPERMYKALVVAYNKGLLGKDETNCRWDEGVTKYEFLSILINSYDNLNTEAIAEEVASENGTADTTPSYLGKSTDELTEEDIAEINDIEHTDAYGGLTDQSTRNSYLNSRPQSEIDADKADGWTGYDVKIGSDGCSYLVDVVSGKEIHIGEAMLNGSRYTGDMNRREDVICGYKLRNPDTTKTDDQIAAMFGL